MSEPKLKFKFSDLPEQIKAEINLETGKIKDFISGNWVSATPEEVEAVQIFARRLVEDYGYPKEFVQTHPQFRVPADR